MVSGHAVAFSTKSAQTFGHVILYLSVDTGVR